MSTNSNLAGLQQIVNLSYLAINGMLISNDATTPNTVLDIGAGIARDQSNTIDLNLGNFEGVITGESANVVTKLIATNVGINGIDTGALANSTVYYVYVIGDAINLVQPTATILSVNAPAIGPVMPFDYNAYRHIGYAITDSSGHFLKGYNYGINGNNRQFIYDAPQQTAITAGHATSYTPVSLAAFVPAFDNIPVSIQYVYTPASASNTFDMQPFGATGNAVVITGQVASVAISGNATVMSKLNVAAPTINYKVANGSDSVSILVAGFSYSV